MDWLYRDALERALFGSCSSVEEQHFETPAHLARIRNIVVSSGGARGAVLFGAFKTLFTIVPKFMGQIERVAGTSVGALTAAMLATGISKKMLIEMGKVNFAAILGRQPIQKTGNRFTSFIRQCIRINLLLRLSQINFREKFQDHNPEMAREIQRQLCEPDIRLAKMTFAMLSYLREIDPEHFKELYITATVQDGSQQMFSAEMTPDHDIAVACRASASIPVLFRPVEMEIKGERKTLYDGGIVEYAPLQIFERKGVGAQEILVIVFEDSRKSIFDMAIRKERFLREGIIPLCTGIALEKPSSELKASVLKKIKDFYPHAITFAVDLRPTAFGKASSHPEKYAQIGQETMEVFLSRYS